MSRSGAGGYGALSRFVTERPVGILVVFLAAAVFGALSLSKLPVELMPELTYPTLTVRTEYPGAAPEEVENDVTRPLEEQLGVVAGLTRISSSSRAGLSDVVLEFRWDVDIHDVTQDVLERLDQVFLPEQAERPLILHYDPELDPIVELSLAGHGDAFTGEAGLRRLRRLAELQIKRDLERIPGVAAVRIKGGLEEEIQVLLDEDKLRRSGLSIRQVIDRLAQENINLAGGTVREGRTEYMVRTINEYQDLQQIRDTVITSVSGREIRVSDLGRVVWAQRDREIITRTDGSESVQLEIYKEGDANIVALAAAIRRAVGHAPEPTAAGGAVAAGDGAPPRPGGSGLAGRLWREEGARLEVVADRSVFIEQSIDEVVQAAALGGALAIVVLFLFLRRIKPTAIVAASIPVSLAIAFAPLYLGGFSLNIMSLGGLALGVGMLVDSSIVVLESIFRCREEGDSVREAAMRGTAEVRSAVIASTLTSIAVFFPMVFVEGVAGQAFADLGVAVVVSLVAAALVAVLLIPMLASRQARAREAGSLRALFVSFPSLGALARALHKPLRADRWWRRIGWALLAPAGVALALIQLAFEIAGKAVLALGAVTAAVVAGAAWVARRVVGAAAAVLGAADPVFRALARGYRRALAFSLRHPWPILAATGVLVALAWQTLGRLDSELLPEVHQGEFTFHVALPVGTPLEETDALLAPVERAILAERDAIRSLLVQIGFDRRNTERSDEGEHTARFKVLLEPTADPAATEERVAARIRRAFASIPDADARVERPVLFSFKAPIEVEIHGDDLHRLRRMAERVRGVLADLPELTDVTTTQRPGAPEVQIVYDRERLTRYGLQIGDVARRVRDKVQGWEATRFNRRDRRIPIVVRLDAGDRETLADIERIVVNPDAERPLPLAAIATVSLGEGPSEVRRVDGRRVALVRANIARGSLGQATEAIDRALSSRIDWPADMTYLFAGQNEEWQRSRSSLWLALALSVFLVYVIMAAQFESLIHPLVIMFTIPLAFIGTVLALGWFGIPLSVVVFLGMIMLAGIVVNNAIVLVDYINTLRRRGLPRTEAIVEAGCVRLRPIVMTTATTVLGLLPMAIGSGDGAELRTPMAIAVISGLVSSTLLTLIVIPVVYSLVDAASRRLLGRAGTSERDEPAAVPPLGADPVTG